MQEIYSDAPYYGSIKSISSKDRRKPEGIDWPFDMQEIESNAPNYGSRKIYFV